MAKARSGTAKLSELGLCKQAVAQRNAGKSCIEVAKTLERSVRWVQKWYERRKRGNNLQDVAHSGRPKNLTAWAEDIARKAENKRH